MSIPQTFSPIVSGIPKIAHPTASPSQLFLATAVEPIPGTMNGSFWLAILLASDYDLKIHI
ncbi:MAG: hypothetical protein U9N36_10175 [Euryarchaeota archaeon]|nr:hypothetical protein [Euryarchaeota archaeon]